jgi:hypothetical protein
MLAKSLLAALLAAIPVWAAEPLPGLRIEPMAGGSIFYVKNNATQPMTGYLIELVDYPGSYYALWQDDLASPIAPGAEKKVPVNNMIVGAAPDYVKIEAAIFADGSSAGVPEKVMMFVERRRAKLATYRELEQRLQKAQAAGTAKDVVIADLKEWADSLQPKSKNRTSQTAVNAMASHDAVANAAAGLETHSMAEELAVVRMDELVLAASKPAL